MKFKFAAVSVMALALFVGPVMAEDPPPVDQPAAGEQPAAEQPAEAAAPAVVPDVVMALVNDRRASQELSDDELKSRAKQARQALKTKGLPSGPKITRSPMANSKGQFPRANMAVAASCSGIAALGPRSRAKARRISTRATCTSHFRANG